MATSKKTDVREKADKREKAKRGEKVKGERNKTDMRKEILARALVDPSFRKKLFARPEAVFGTELDDADKAALARIKKVLPSIDDIVTHLAGEVLCGGGGGCPGLA